MKKLFFTIILFSFIFWFNGCSEGSILSSENDDVEVFNKAGTNLESPNTFDASGILCVLGDNELQGTINTPMEIWMGVGNNKAGTLVGRITFEGNDVKIDLTDANNDGVPDMYPYVVTLVHVDFAKTPEEIPQTKRGNPVPGKFEFHKEADPYATSIVLEDAIKGGDKYGAIHMEVVKYGGVEGFGFYLPNNEVKMIITQVQDNISLFQLKIEGGGFVSDFNSSGKEGGEGIYESWCIARDLSIKLKKEYDAYLYSSYEVIPTEILIQAGIIEDNLDNLNYLINRFNVGDEIFANDGISLGILTVRDMQWAIWRLINGKQYSNPIVLRLVEDSIQNGNNFIPGCDDRIIFIAVPTDPDLNTYAQFIIGQPIIGEIPVPCEDEGGTAWGDGYYGATFPGNQWGTWFKYGCE